MHIDQTLGERLRAHLPEIAAALLAAVIGITIWLAVEYERQVGWVQHSLEVENSIGRLFSAVQDAETGNRGYIITGQAEYLEPYLRASADFDAEYEVLRNLTADNVEQQSTLAELQPIAQQRFARLSEGIELRRTQGIDAAVRFIQTNQGHVLMQEVRDAIAGMRVTEARVLESRLAEARRFSKAAAIAALIGIALVILSITAWIWNARRDASALRATMAERERAEAQVRQMQKMEAIGQLTGGIAHDFNNMLAIIISGLNLIQKRLAAGDTNIRRFVEAAMDGAQRAVAITSRLMAFSRQQPLAPQQMDANRLVSGMSELMQRALGETIHVETVLAGGLWVTHADPAQLESAILNLCVNARDAMPDGGKLTIETANCHLDEAYARQNDIPAGQYVMLAVTDTGTGMQPDILARAFDPFFTTKPVGKGTGLGLSQVYGFVKQSGGHIKIYSELRHGTTVKIYLPRLHNTAALTAGSAAGKPSTPAYGSNASDLILVVEDDDRVRKASVSLLRELGYTVIHADGARSALGKLDEHPGTSLLFTDIVMPEVNGRQLADEATRRRPDLRILFTTGFTRNAIVHQGVLDAGVNFIAKPFTLEQLAAKIGEVLAPKGEAGGSASADSGDRRP